MNPTTLTRNYDRLSVWERVRLRLAAQVRKDEVEEKRLHDSAPVQHTATLPHLQTEMVLHTMALMYITEQLESVSWHFFAQMQLREGNVEEPYMLGNLAALSGVHAFCFQIRAAGWRKFCQSVGVDADQLLAGNHEGTMIKFCEDQMHKFDPGAPDLVDWFRSRGMEPKSLITADSEYRRWRWMLEKATHDAPCLN